MSEKRVHVMTDSGGWPDGWTVRGTTDIRQAKRAIVESMIGEPDDYGTPHTARSAYECVRSAQSFFCHVGLMRWNPCNPASCHVKHLGHLAWVDHRGPGVWEGVQIG